MFAVVSVCCFDLGDALLHFGNCLTIPHTEQHFHLITAVFYVILKAVRNI